MLPLLSMLWRLPPEPPPPPPRGPAAERSTVDELKSQLGSVKEAVEKEQELSEKLRREAAAAAESAQRQVCAWAMSCAAPLPDSSPDVTLTLPRPRCHASHHPWRSYRAAVPPAG